MNRTSLLATPVLAVALIGAGTVGLHAKQAAVPTAQPAAKAAPTDPSAPLPMRAKPAVAGQTKMEESAAARLSGDQAYRANCTRCHSELPKLQPRAMTTVLMHMRVRANIPRDEAHAILEYLTR